MSTKHTAGPWDIVVEYEGDSTYPGRFKVDGGKILTFGRDGEEGIYAHNAADVALIAAAPDLLEACEAVAATTWSCNTAEKIGAQVRAAIKKARGET